MTRGKRMHQVCARLDEDLLAELDAYQRERERETGIPMSRSLALVEALEAWRTRVRARVDRPRVTRNG